MATISRVLWNARVNDPNAALQHALLMVSRWARGEKFEGPGAAARDAAYGADTATDDAGAEDTDPAVNPAPGDIGHASNAAADGSSGGAGPGDDGDMSEPLAEGSYKFWSDDGGPRKVSVKMFEDQCGFVVESTKKNIHEATVLTRIRVVALQDRIHVWIDNEADGANYSAIYAPGRAHLVRALLQVGTDARLGGSEIVANPVTLEPGEAAKLEEEIFAQYRRLPLVVVTYRSDPPLGDDVEMANELADRLVGLARVIALTSGAQDEFRRMQPDMAVWGGAVRVYGTENLTNPRAHRFYPYSKLISGGRSQPASRVEQRSVNLLPHKALRDFAQSVEAVEEPSLEDEIESLEDKCAQLEAELDELRRMLIECEEARNSLLGQVERLTRAGTEAGWIDDLTDLETSSPDGPDDTVSTIQEAVLQGQVYLSDLLVIPEDVVRDVDRLESHPMSSVWANTLWRGLQSLHRYARENLDDSFTGGFYLWCQHSGHTSINPSKVAMKESDTVRQSARFRSLRMFPCDSQIEEAVDGQVFMEAHLKISEGGGSLSPRLYFYDDLGGPTGKIHIGFIGPHDLVPNTKT
ncbi:MAG: hypothetical protein Q4P33_08170 [Flaviflexus sp.]|nr:hypothetical protein [Flaviflexus sp.]